ncbi:hypothetical protein LZC95_07725 [Pendulispora brunnea]|uniref:Uncharacterized protein n=1 Tax=Pendulispora brunnea TaxID=2905690 RepID=A0ABZ2KDL1_9BACT
MMVPYEVEAHRQALLRPNPRGAACARSAPKVGDRYGELTIIRLASVARAGRVWELECDCGGKALRTTHALTSSIRNGHVPMCAACARELRAGSFHAHHAAQLELLRARWQAGMGLYSAGDVERISEAVLADLEAEFGPVEEPVDPRDFLVDSTMIWQPPKGKRDLADEAHLRRNAKRVARERAKREAAKAAAARRAAEREAEERAAEERRAREQAQRRAAEVAATAEWLRVLAGAHDPRAIAFLSPPSIGRVVPRVVSSVDAMGRKWLTVHAQAVVDSVPQTGEGNVERQCGAWTMKVRDVDGQLQQRCGEPATSGQWCEAHARLFQRRT